VDLVYKVDYLIQSSPLNSLVLTLIQGSFSWSTLKSWVCNSVDIFNSRFYHQITVNSRKKCGISNVWSVVKNNIFYNNDKRNTGRKISEIVQK